MTHLFDDTQRRLTERLGRIDARLSVGASDGENARLRRERDEIDRALGRLASGAYGKCETCGVAVGRQRLMAIPEERLCLDCGSAAGG
jgi:DnaK suppressor protein